MTYPAEKADDAARNWKDTCGNLMAAQPGCLGEEFLRRGDVPTEFVSYSVWDSEDSIRTYLEGDTYRTIREHNRANGAMHVTVRLYDPV
jgi:heme-degrading monooxygenase HmoA